MNLWTMTARGILPGIKIDSPGLVRLGDTGRGRTLVNVGVEAGAVVRDGRVLHAGLTRRPAFTAPITGDPCIVRAATEGAYTRGAPGHVVVIGDAIIAVQGGTAWGDAGRLGYHPDVLIVMRPGSAAVVTFSGGRGKGGGIRLLWIPEDGGPQDGRVPLSGDAGDESLSPYYDGQSIRDWGDERVREFAAWMSIHGADKAPNTTARVGEHARRVSTVERF